MLRIAVLGVSIDVVTMAQAVSKLEDYIKEGKPRFVATANAEMVMNALQDTQLATALASADLVVPDGAGVVWAARYLGQVIPERVAGYDLVQEMLAKAAVQRYRIYFFGGAPDVAMEASKVAAMRYPGLQVVGVRHGFFSKEEEPALIKEVQDMNPDILLVALGVPRQEKWLATHLTELNVPVAIGVGGTFDVMAGIARRAPVWMQRSSLEWLFRLLCQPKRFVRMLALPAFVLRVMATKKH